MVSIQGYGDAQILNAATIADVARAMGLGDRGALLGVMCAMGESSLRNIDYGDWETNGVRNPDGTPTSSIGLFQQQAWWGTPSERMDPRYAAWAFFNALVKIRDWVNLAPTIAIHRVQINADPNHYAKYETPARAVLAHIRDQRMRGAFMADPYDIIELPWQPGVYGRRALVDALDRAGRPWTNSVLRLKAEQQKAWDAYQNGTGSPADDPNRPDVFPLAHVRGIAADIDATAENVRRLSAVGLVRPYSYEPWHWQLPGNVRVWPLIDSIPDPASLKPKGPLMALSDEEQNDLLRGVRNIEQFIATGGVSTGDPNYVAKPGTVLWHLQNLAGHIYKGGVDAQRPDYLGAPGTIYNLVKSRVRRGKNATPTVLPQDGREVFIDQIQDQADTNTLVRELKTKLTELAAAVKKITPGKQ